MLRQSVLLIASIQAIVAKWLFLHQTVLFDIPTHRLASIIPSSATAIANFLNCDCLAYFKEYF